MASGSKKNLKHPWNLFNAQKALYSVKRFFQIFFFKAFLLGTVQLNVFFFWGNKSGSSMAGVGNVDPGGPLSCRV